ncbi:hypothetical protein LTR08_005125 [Meristemomyces frigidus]|nr:hypothetical protein LTR08_005125 [Meristemomyces frigidus]
MEKYGQYRDKGSGIAPFFPIAPPPSTPLLLPWHIFLVSLRLPLLVAAWVLWLALIQHLPPGGLFRKANQWCLLGIPGVWWIDLQVDGVKRGALGKRKGALPDGGTIIAANWTSPLDILYLAAIFDPIFTLSTPHSSLVRPVSQETALAACFGVPNPLLLGAQPAPTTLSALVHAHPTRTIVNFPEGTTSNGRGILRLTPSLTSASPSTHVYPVSIKYAAPDIVTPIPGWLEAAKFIWRLNSAENHCIRVRVGLPLTMAALTSPITNTTNTTKTPKNKSTTTPPNPPPPARARNTFESNFFDTLQTSPAPKVAGESDDSDTAVRDTTSSQRKALDAVAEDLARLGRVKRVDLGVEEKAWFAEAWGGRGGRVRK